MISDKEKMYGDYRERARTGNAWMSITSNGNESLKMTFHAYHNGTVIERQAYFNQDGMLMSLVSLKQRREIGEEPVSAPCINTELLYSQVVYNRNLFSGKMRRLARVP